jgi:hypothetical protein
VEFAIVALAVSIVAQAAAVAFWGGRMHQSIKSLLDEVPAVRSTSKEITLLIHRVEACERKLERSSLRRGEIYGRMNEMRRDLDQVRHIVGTFVPKEDVE